MCCARLGVGNGKQSIPIWTVYVTFGVYIGFGGLIDGYSALGVVYEVSLEVVMTTHA